MSNQDMASRAADKLAAELEEIKKIKPRAKCEAALGRLLSQIGWQV